MRGHVRKRASGTWAFVVDDGQDPETGKRRQRWRSGFRTRKEAEAALRAALGRVDAGHDPLPVEITVRDFVNERWLPHLEAQGKPRPRTAHRYAELLNHHVLSVIGGMSMTKVSPGAVQAALDAMSAKGLAPRTVAQARASISSAFSAAVRWQLVQYNPVRATSTPTPRDPHLVVPTAAQLRELARVAEGGRWAIPVLLAATTGARRGELLGITWTDVDLDRARVHIRQALQRVGGELQLVPLKTDRSQRTIPLQGFVVERLRRHRAEQAERRLLLGTAWSWGDVGLVCERGDGAPADPDALTHAFARFATEVGVPGARLHDCRHGVGQTLAKNGTSAEVTSKFLGHSSVAFTASVYLHPDEEQLERAARGLGEAFGA